VNQRELASVLFAAIGLLIAISRIPELVVHLGLLGLPLGTRMAAQGTFAQGVTILAMAGTLLQVVLGLGLAALRDRLASGFFGPGGGTLRVPEAQAVGLSVLGCYLAITAAGRLFWPRELRVSAAIQVALGIALFLGARGLAGLWSRLRSR
jgi:hypothetical protein